MTREDCLGLLDGLVSAADGEFADAKDAMDSAGVIARDALTRKLAYAKARDDMKALYEKEARAKAKPARPDAPSGELPEPGTEKGA